MEANKINTKTQNKTFGFYAKNAGLLILKFFLYVLYSAVVTLPVFLTTVSCTTLFFLAVATFVCVITIVPMFLVPIAFFAFLINAPVACLITCGTILGAVVLAAIIIQIVAMCSAASEYKNTKLMELYRTSNHIWKGNIHLWGSVYSVYDVISAIGKQKKISQNQNQDKCRIYNDNKRKISISDDKLKDQNQVNINDNKKKNIETNKSNANLKISETIEKISEIKKDNKIDNKSNGDTSMISEDSENNSSETIEEDDNIIRDCDIESANGKSTNSNNIKTNKNNNIKNLKNPENKKVAPQNNIEMKNFKIQSVISLNIPKQNRNNKKNKENGH